MPGAQVHGEERGVRAVSMAECPATRQGAAKLKVGIPAHARHRPRVGLVVQPQGHQNLAARVRREVEATDRQAAVRPVATSEHRLDRSNLAPPPARTPWPTDEEQGSRRHPGARPWAPRGLP